MMKVTHRDKVWSSSQHNRGGYRHIPSSSELSIVKESGEDFFDVTLAKFSLGCLSSAETRQHDVDTPWLIN